MNGDMNGDMNGATEESMDASSQGSAYNSVGAATSEAIAVNNHSDSSNQDDDSNMGADSNGELSNGGPNVEQNGSNTENKESADSSDKQSVKCNAQGVSTVNEDSVDIDINVVIATTVRSRENNKSGGNSATSLVEDSNNHNEGSESATLPISSGSANETSDSSEANSAAIAGVVVDSADISNNKPNSNNIHNASRSRKRGHGDPEGSGLPLKKVLPDPNSKQMLGRFDNALDDKMEVDSTTNVDSYDSMSGNGPAGVQGVTSQNNCTNSDSADSGGNIKEDGDGDSSSEESEQDQAQHVHEIQSDSEDDVRGVSKTGDGVCYVLLYNQIFKIAFASMIN